jgi:hypothetical protein
MNTFQTLTAIVVLVFVLSVIVQAVQEFIKAVLGTKAGVMKQAITKFMGNHLSLSQVQNALKLRGLDITALENFNKEDFRKLLDGIQFEKTQLDGVVTSTEASIDQIKDNIAASYEAARASFQQMYTKKNKLFVIVLSLLAVSVLNANLIILYQQISADQVVQQAIIGKAVSAHADEPGNNQGQQTDLGAVYSASRNQIVQALQTNPILVRTLDYPQDFKDHPYGEIPGLLMMGILVSLGAPFWNDVLKGMMGINNTLNTNGKKTS